MMDSLNPSKQPMEENLGYKLEGMLAHEHCFELFTDLFSPLCQAYRFNDYVVRGNIETAYLYSL